MKKLIALLLVVCMIAGLFVACKKKVENEIPDSSSSVESGVGVPLEAWLILGVGCLVSFLVSMAAIRFLMDFVKKHSFAPFGVYRIVLGTIVLLYFALIG